MSATLAHEGPFLTAAAAELIERIGHRGVSDAVRPVPRPPTIADLAAQRSRLMPGTGGYPLGSDPDRDADEFYFVPPKKADLEVMLDGIWEVVYSANN